MFPIILDVSRVEIVVIGEGPATERRLGLLRDSGASNLKYFKELPDEIEYERADIVFLADFDDDTSNRLKDLIRKKGILVNVEDKIDLCDFHVPAIVRRGDLLITSSTGGKSPGLARRIRKELQQQFNEEWKERMGEMAAKREEWKKQGLSFEEVGKKTEEFINEKGWF